MKHYKPISPIGLLTAAFVLMLQSSAVFAAAGGAVTNQARLQYDLGGTPTFIRSAPGAGSTDDTGAVTSFVEDRVINFTVAEVGASSLQVAPGATQQALQFTVTNTGNDTLDFVLLGLDKGTGGAFTPTNIQAFVDDGDAIFNAGDTATSIDNLAPLGVATVWLIADIPGGATGGQIADLTLVVHAAESATGVAISLDNNGNETTGGAGAIWTNGTVTIADETGNGVSIADTAAMETVFSDGAGTLDGQGNADGTQNAQHSADDQFIVGVPALNIKKDIGAVQYDAVNGNANPKAIPTAVIPYTIIIENVAGVGVGSAFLTSMVDDLVANFALQPQFTQADGQTALAAPVAGVTDAFATTVSGSTRAANATLTLCDTAVAAEGCSDGGGGAGDIITFDFTLMDILPAEGTYAAGELKPGETITIDFKLIVQ